MQNIRKNVPIDENLYSQLKEVADKYYSNITKLVAAAVSYALKHQSQVWGFKKEGSK